MFNRHREKQALLACESNAGFSFTLLFKTCNDKYEKSLSKCVIIFDNYSQWKFGISMRKAKKKAHRLKKKN